MQGLSPDVAKKLILSVGRHSGRRPLSPLEAAEAIKQALNAGATPKELAMFLHYEGPSMIGRYLRLLSLPAQLQPLVGWGADASTLSFSSASEVARLAPPEQPTLGEAILTHQLGLSEVKQIVQIRQRSGKTVEESVQAVLDQRPTVVQRHLIIGAVMGHRLRPLLAQMTQGERNALLQRALEKHGPHVAFDGAKLGISSFTLIGDKQFQKAITSLPNGFEEAVTQYVQQELHHKG